MSGMAIRLQWARYPDGFIVVKDRPPPHLRDAHEFDEAPWLAPRNPKRSETYIAEGIGQGIFADLANVARAKRPEEVERNVLAFVNKCGPLDLDNGRPPLILDVWGAAQSLYRVANPATRISKSRAFGIVEHFLGDPSLRMRCAKLPGDSAPRFFLEPVNLLRFCYVEFLQTLEGDALKIGRCPPCGALFMLGAVGRQPTYCSGRCRQAMYRSKHG